MSEDEVKTKEKEEKKEPKQTVLSSKNITMAEMKTIISKVRAFNNDRGKAQNDQVKNAYLASLCPNPEDLIKLLAVYEELFPEDKEGIDDIKKKLEEEYKKKAKFMGVFLFMIADSLKSIYKKAFKNYVRAVNKENKLAQKQAEDLVRAKGAGVDEFDPANPRARGRFSDPQQLQRLVIVFPPSFLFPSGGLFRPDGREAGTAPPPPPTDRRPAKKPAGRNRADRR